MPAKGTHLRDTEAWEATASRTKEEMVFAPDGRQLRRLPKLGGEKVPQCL